MEHLLEGLERKSALQIIVKLLEFREEVNLTTLFKSCVAGQRAMYTALEELEKLELINNYQTKLMGKRCISLTNLGEQVAYRVIDIMTLLESQRFKDRKKIDLHGYNW